MTLCMCVILTFVIACALSEILAQIKQKSKFDLSDIQSYCYILICDDIIGISLRKLHDPIQFGNTSILLNNIQHYVKMGKSEILKI